MFNHSKPKAKASLYLRLLQYVRYYWWVLVIAIVSSMIFSGVDAGFTYLLKPILNKGFIDRDLHFVQLLPFLVIGAFIVRGLTYASATYFMAVVSRGVIMRFRQVIFRHLLRLPASYYDNISSGQILSIVIYNVGQVANASARALTDFVQSGCLIIGLLIVMFSISWKLSLLYFIVMPIIAISVQFTAKRLRRINLNIQTQMGSVANIAKEAIDGYKVIRSFGSESYETDRFDKATQKNRHRE